MNNKMNPSQIQPKMRFGNWEVIKFDHSNEHRVKYFLCRCLVCGTTRPVRASALLDGTSTSCSKKCSMSLLGQTFGEWTVLKRDASNPRNYICRCNCGTIKSVFGSSLKNGTSKSCGCLKRQMNKQRHEEKAEQHIGEKHGMLTILEPQLKGQDYWYKCKCDCGNEAIVLGKRLFHGDTQSCGCLNSKANELMDKILTKYKIPFKREYRFEDCKDQKTLPFDFALFNEQKELIGLIENNGRLHYSTSGTSWDTPDRLITQQKHDYIKRKFCEDNHIPFLVIPYQYFDNIEKFLITSDFWEIITKNFND